MCQARVIYHGSNYKYNSPAPRRGTSGKPAEATGSTKKNSEGHYFFSQGFPDYDTAPMHLILFVIIPVPKIRLPNEVNDLDQFPKSVICLRDFRKYFFFNRDSIREPLQHA